MTWSRRRSKKMVKRRRKKIREMGWEGGLMRYREIFEEIEEDREKKKG